MWIEKNDTDCIEIESNIKNVNLEDNIIFKAYKVLKEKFPFLTGIKVILNKKIPMQAGLAGGSTDCASFLIGMKKLFSLNFSEEEIVKMSATLGADVPPCLYGGIVKAEGIGDIITKIDSDFQYYLVIIKPKNTYCCTKEMFEKLDNMKYKSEIKTDKVLSGMEKKDIITFANNLYNDFEKVTTELVEISEAKKVLKENGAINAILTGAGSCVFGIFENKERAKQAYQGLKDKYEAYICKSYNRRSKI